VFLRNFLYDKKILKSYKSDVPLISIGNLTFGGTGKTPLVAYLSEFFQNQGKKVVIVSRGYKGSKSSKKVFIVSDGKGHISGGPGECGDEPFLLATWLPNTPVLISKKRASAVQQAESQFSPDYILLDDGYQHRAVSRDIDILLIDAMDPFGNYRLPPSGILREPIENLCRADIMLINRAEEDEDLLLLRRILRRHNEKALIFQLGNRITKLARLATGDTLRPEDISGMNSYLFCAIGNPHGFSLNIEKLGAHVVGYRYFRDHHQYTEEDLQKITDEAKEAGASIILTTQKDSVRIKRHEDSSFLPLYYAKLELALYREEDFLQALKDLLDQSAKGKKLSK
jgi:tetraacyldisaccharide 4'-kinase